MKNKSILIGYIMIILGISNSSCKHDIIIPSDYGYKGPCHCPDDSIPTLPKNPCDSDTVYFRNVILPLIQSSCGSTNCHDQNSSEKRPLISYNTIRQSGYVVSGNANKSEMYKKLTETNPQDRMPPAPKTPLSQAQINLIKKWIDQGAKDNYCSSCDSTNIKFALNIWPIFRDNCMGCHSGSTPSKGLLLTNYTQVNGIVLDGRLKNVLIAANGYVQMPPGGRLVPCKIILINKWITNGAHND